MTERRRVLITGASAGIGKSFARVFAENGWDTVLVARREDRLQALATELTEAYGGDHRVFAADLARVGAPAKIEAFVKEAGLSIDGVVNNAGYGLKKKFLEASWEEHRAFMQVLMVSLTELCHRFAPAMVERGFGRIINVASIAAHAPEYPGNLYNAAKAYVLHATEALALELKPRGVHVTAVCPGFTHTEFHDNMGVKKALAGVPSWMWMDADEVARLGYEASMRGQTVCVTGWVNKALVGLMRLMPYSMRERVAAKQKVVMKD
ncbi:SDR family oxidoreductase [Hahella sp. SMD15-11]|uniref:SDR family oxidoreductase n=1 Tax=Thermohahella caldifontis TaxID=3142973 RepID=A0AB39UT78_9GAMM